MLLGKLPQKQTNKLGLDCADNVTVRKNALLGVVAIRAKMKAAAFFFYSSFLSVFICI